MHALLNLREALLHFRDAVAGEELHRCNSVANLCMFYLTLEKLYLTLETLLQDELHRCNSVANLLRLLRLTGRY